MKMIHNSWTFHGLPDRNQSVELKAVLKIEVVRVVEWLLIC
ncbi:MAG: hypothetical protein N3F04_07075 [Candidatus Nezhaarchaeota archaeon]|nr:hypothetical protein [Candidatus Nezhaarchaeota archaeon]MCX8142505.1 hypothetical protein [Candidatus Nezhaarchaeota archaeon]MDW8050522.1 hypothetical protein [Nitrososphaerota archaeon]